jgi:uncharacterized protein DUF4126
MQSQVIVPLDGSASAEAILPHALLFAQQRQCILTLLQIVTPSDLPGATDKVMPDNWSEGEVLSTQRYDELIFLLAARFFHLYKVNPDFSYITQDWFLIALAILALADSFADKIPSVDHIWDAIHTVLRPIAGALVAAASSQAVAGPGLVTALALGGAVAGATHATKATTRLASTATTVGFGNILLSVGEDIVMVASVLLSLLAPSIMVIALALLLVLFFLLLPFIGLCWLLRSSALFSERMSEVASTGRTYQRLGVKHTAAGFLWQAVALLLPYITQVGIPSVGYPLSPCVTDSSA